VTHHPLKVTFPVSQAVYPLKLTGSDVQAIQLDLFVIAERQATAAGMTTWVCDTFDRDSKYHHRFEDYACEMPPVYKSRTTFTRIGIPAVSGLMWPGCVVTRLHGRLDADDMRQDMGLTWMDPEPMSATLYSQSSAIAWSAAIAMFVLAVYFAGMTWRAARKGWSWQVMLRRRLVAAVALGLVVGGARYAMVPIVPVKATGKRAILATMIGPSAHGYALQQLLERPPATPFPVFYRMLVREWRPDLRMDESADMDKPGDYTIEATDSGWRLTIIDWAYVPVTIAISADGRPKAATD